MKRSVPAVLSLAVILGCEGPPPADQVVPAEQVPANVMEVAKKQLPGLTVTTVYKMKVDGKDAFEIRFKDKRGKTREVEVSATGDVLAIE
jgi:hypothetical protein